MRIPELIEAAAEGGEPCFSFEFFPPKTDEGVATLFESIEDLNRLEPSFVSVTYGAGGSTRDGTVEITTRIKRDYGIETMAHLSVVGETPDGLDAILDRLADAGIENILALRGDPPRGESDFTPPPDGLRSSAELAAFIRGRESTSGFGIGASCSPGGPPGGALGGGRHRLPPREGRRRRGVPDQPALLRQRRLLRLGRARARGRHRRADRPRRAADHLPRGSAPVLRRLQGARFPNASTTSSPRSTAIRTPSGRSASPTPRGSANSCSPPARPASTSSSSTARRRSRRSWARSRPAAPGSALAARSWPPARAPTNPAHQLPDAPAERPNSPSAPPEGTGREAEDPLGVI